MLSPIEGKCQRYKGGENNVQEETRKEEARRKKRVIAALGTTHYETRGGNRLVFNPIF